MTTLGGKTKGMYFYSFYLFLNNKFFFFLLKFGITTSFVQTVCLIYKGNLQKICDQKFWSKDIKRTVGNVTKQSDITKLVVNNTLILVTISW